MGFASFKLSRNMQMRFMSPLVRKGLTLLLFRCRETLLEKLLVLEELEATAGTAEEAVEMARAGSCMSANDLSIRRRVVEERSESSKEEEEEERIGSSAGQRRLAGCCCCCCCCCCCGTTSSIILKRQFVSPAPFFFFSFLSNVFRCLFVFSPPIMIYLFLFPVSLFFLSHPVSPLYK